MAFESTAANLVPGDTNAASDVFVHHVGTATTTRVSVGTGGTEAQGASTAPVISADGAVVAFESTAANLVPGDTNAASDVFVHDRQSHDPGATPPPGPGTTTAPPAPVPDQPGPAGSTGGPLPEQGPVGEDGEDGDPTDAAAVDDEPAVDADLADDETSLDEASDDFGDLELDDDDYDELESGETDPAEAEADQVDDDSDADLDADTETGQADADNVGEETEDGDLATASAARSATTDGRSGESRKAGRFAWPVIAALVVVAGGFCAAAATRPFGRRFLRGLRRG